MAYFGNDYSVPDGTAGATPSAPASPHSFQGHKTPFRLTKPAMGLGPFRKPAEYADADNQPISEAIFKAWEAAGGPTGNTNAPDPYKTPGGDPVLPTGPQQDAAVQKIINASETPPPDTARLAGALSGQAPKDVTLDTAQSDAARGQQQANIADLQRAAAGFGPAADLAKARLAQALRAGAAQASGIAQGATGAARKGAARTAALAANQASLNAGEQVAMLEAQDRQQAQQTLAQTLQGVRGADINQAGNAATVQAGNEARSMDWDQFSAKYNVELEDLKLRVGEFQQRAAQGVLDAGNKQEAIRQARRGLDMAEEKFRRIDLPAAEREAAQADREFWLRAITALTAAVVPIATGTPKTPKAAHGGIVDKPTHLIAGEAGPEIIIPVNNVAPRLAQALAVENKPFDRGNAPDLGALLASLQQPQQQRQLPPELLALLASANNQNRKQY